MSHPYIQAALARERQATLLAEAEAARLARQARSSRRKRGTPAVRSSPFRRISARLPRIPIRKERQMPLFMDVHNVKGGVSAADVANAHEADVATQEAHGVNYLRYWVNEEAGKIFCLVEAPDAAAAITVHQKSHGLVADEIYPVTEHA